MTEDGQLKQLESKEVALCAFFGSRMGFRQNIVCREMKFPNPEMSREDSGVLDG